MASDIPPYVKSPNQENYNEELNQTLFDNIGPNGFRISVVTNAQLTTNIIPNGQGGFTSLAALSPDGTLFYVSDGGPPDLVLKRSGVLRRIATNPYP